MNKNNKGFTMAELIVTIGVLAVFAVLCLVIFRGIQNSARVSANQASALEMAKAFQYYESAGGDASNIPPEGGSVFAWSGVVLIHGGEDIAFGISLSSVEKFNQVRKWVIRNDEGAWIVDPNADFSENLP